MNALCYDLMMEDYLNKCVILGNILLGALHDGDALSLVLQRYGFNHSGNTKLAYLSTEFDSRTDRDIC